MFWYGNGWRFWQIGIMWVGMIIFWALIIWAVFALITNLSHRYPEERRNSETRRILDERLARGEIGVDEYHKIIDVLRSHSQFPDKPTGK
ncbi:MAG: SHOCT domain-containing protein [Acidimicrobiales bacterium]|nr:SHOCT domain-containing protein [Acidimicrobiales bacterium]